jgi:hypothetical protein
MVRTPSRCLREVVVDFGLFCRKSKFQVICDIFAVIGPMYFFVGCLLTIIFITFPLFFHFTDTSFYFNTKEAVSHNEAISSTSTTWTRPR